MERCQHEQSQTLRMRRFPEIRIFLGGSWSRHLTKPPIPERTHQQPSERVHEYSIPKFQKSQMLKPLGKLAALRALFSTSTPLVHIDESADVLTELRDYIRAHKSINWRIIGISVPGKPVEGVPYVRNVEALETILKRTGLAGSIAAVP